MAWHVALSHYTVVDFQTLKNKTVKAILTVVYKQRHISMHLLPNFPFPMLHLHRPRPHFHNAAINSLHARNHGAKISSPRPEAADRRKTQHTYPARLSASRRASSRRPTANPRRQDGQILHEADCEAALPPADRARYTADTRREAGRAAAAGRHGRPVLGHAALRDNVLFGGKPRGRQGTGAFGPC